jgi:RNase adaptor protein for sRNA GlmZ degradation
MVVSVPARQGLSFDRHVQFDRRAAEAHFERPFCARDIGLCIFVMSFAYCQAISREADLTFDVRCLENSDYIAIGCTGDGYCLPYDAERLAAGGFSAELSHRDLSFFGSPRPGPAGGPPLQARRRLVSRAEGTK